MLIDALISQDGPYRSRADPWYGRYDGQATAYRDPNYQYREPQPERPSSRASQYSDRPSSRSVKLFLSLLPLFTRVLLHVYNVQFSHEEGCTVLTIITVTVSARQRVPWTYSIQKLFKSFSTASVTPWPLRSNP